MLSSGIPWNSHLYLLRIGECVCKEKTSDEWDSLHNRRLFSQTGSARHRGRNGRREGEKNIFFSSSRVAFHARVSRFALGWINACYAGYEWDILWYTTRKPWITIVPCHRKYVALHNRCGARWEGWVWYRWIVLIDGRFGGIPTNIQRLSCILIGCISYGMV